MDSSYLTSALIKPDDKIINLSNDFFFKCLELEKIDYCDSSSERDKICLIYLNNVSKTDGHLLEWNYDIDFDSLLIYKNDKIINSIVDKSSSMLDNQEIILIISRKTASSAELFSILLRRYAQAKLVGEKTQGKNELLKVVPVNNRFRISLPAGEFLIFGEDISDGILPD